MSEFEGIRYLMFLDSAEIKLNFVGWNIPNDNDKSEVDTT